MTGELIIRVSEEGDECNMECSANLNHVGLGDKIELLDGFMRAVELSREEVIFMLGYIEFKRAKEGGFASESGCIGD